MMKQAAPAISNVVWVGRSSGVQHLVEGGAVRDFMQFRQLVGWGVAFTIRRDDLERKAMEAADLIVVGSPLVRFAMEQLYAGEVGKIYANVVSTADFVYAEAERFRPLRRPFPERDIDVLFVARNWDRPEENYPLAARIAARCDGLDVAIVGKTDRPRNGASHRGPIRGREELYAVLGRAKTLVCPSLLDGGPAVLFEASAMECNVIASPNCGNWQLCHPDLLAERCMVGTFLDRIERSLRQPYRDNREQFQGGSVDLLDTLSVL
jgi:glycosyltransferase involved in cell wall biosynthesis